MPQLFTSVENIFKEKPVILSRLNQYLVEIFLSHLSPWKCKHGPNFPTYYILSVRGFYPENEAASFLSSLHLPYSVPLTGLGWKSLVEPFLGTTLEDTLKAHPDGILWRKVCLKFPFPCPFPQLKVYHLIQNYREADNKILLWIYEEVSQSWWKNEPCRNYLLASCSEPLNTPNLN